jgi:hypothetical protein
MRSVKDLLWSGVHGCVVVVDCDVVVDELVGTVSFSVKENFMTEPCRRRVLLGKPVGKDSQISAPSVPVPTYCSFVLYFIFSRQKRSLSDRLSYATKHMYQIHFPHIQYYY